MATDNPAAGDAQRAAELDPRIEEILARNERRDAYRERRGCLVVDDTPEARAYDGLALKGLLDQVRLGVKRKHAHYALLRVDEEDLGELAYKRLKFTIGATNPDKEGEYRNLPNYIRTFKPGFWIEIDGKKLIIVSKGGRRRLSFVYDPKKRTYRYDGERIRSNPNAPKPRPGHRVNRPCR